MKEETATVEMKEQQLVLDCVKQLGELKFCSYTISIVIYLGKGICCSKCSESLMGILCACFITVEAKDQISDLTDEISQKAEDNIRQQVTLQSHSQNINYSCLLLC